MAGGWLTGSSQMGHLQNQAGRKIQRSYFRRNNSFIFNSVRIRKPQSNFLLSPWRFLRLGTEQFFI
jgi:hypothetical protein